MIEKKTIAQVFEEVKGDAALQKEFFAAEKSGAIEAFAAAHGCKATAEEVLAFLKTKLSEPGELSDEELDQVAGGKAQAPMRLINTDYILNAINH